MTELPTKDEIVGIISGQDMGPGISLSAVLSIGMAHYYLDDPAGAARSAHWAIGRVASLIIDRIETGQGGEAKVSGDDK